MDRIGTDKDVKTVLINIFKKFDKFNDHFIYKVSNHRQSIYKHFCSTSVLFLIKYFGIVCILKISYEIFEMHN